MSAVDAVTQQPLQSVPQPVFITTSSHIDDSTQPFTPYPESQGVATSASDNLNGQGSARIFKEGGLEVKVYWKSCLKHQSFSKLTLLFLFLNLTKVNTPCAPGADTQVKLGPEKSAVSVPGMFI